MQAYRCRNVAGSALARGILAFVVSIVATGLLRSGPAAAMDAATETYDPPQACPLCDGSLRVPIVRLTPAWLDARARDRARANAAQIARIDSLFQAGYYGSPKTHEARRAAHLLTRLTLVNGYVDLLWLAGDTTRVYEADEATLREVNARYSDVLLFATARLQRVRLGLGRACMHYDVATMGEGESVHGGKHLRWRIKDAQVGGRTRRLLSLDLPTATDDVVEVLLAPHHTFRVEYARCAGPPAPYEFFLVHDLEGGWLRKSGTHRPTAYMYWVTPTGPRPRFGASIAGDAAERPGERGDPDALPWGGTNSGSLGNSGDFHPTLSAAGSTYSTAGASVDGLLGTNGGLDDPPVDLPETPLVGLRIYVPGLRLRLPSFLPDINFDDLREVEPPMPILDMEFLRQKSQPAWLGSADHLGFKDWKGYGPLPPAIRLRFPDL